MSNENERDIETLRGSIEETRQRIAGEIEAIGERLTPAHAREVAKEKAKEKVVELKDKAMDSMRSSARGAARMTSSAGANLGAAIRENPIPTAMVAVGAGLLLYRAIERARAPQLEMTFEDYDEGEPLVGVEEDEGTRIRRMARGTRDRIASTRERVGDVADTARERVGHAAHVVRERTEDLAARSRVGAQHAVSRSRSAYEHNPLAFGAGALLVGLGIGMLLPHTERENRLLGDTRDRLLERARGVAREATDIAVESAKEGMRTARETGHDELGERDLLPR